VATVVTQLSKIIMNLSNSIDVLISSNRDVLVDVAIHNRFMLELNIGVNIRNTIDQMLSMPDFDEWKNTLSGIKTDFDESYRAYISALDINDPQKILQRPNGLN
jgi:hypothetical protein